MKTEMEWNTLLLMLSSEGLKEFLLWVKENRPDLLTYPEPLRTFEGGMVSTDNCLTLWKEGYAITGQNSDATYLGNFPTNSLKEAVKQFKESKEKEGLENSIDLEKLTDWGCRFFNNEADARRSFG